MMKNYEDDECRQLIAYRAFSVILCAGLIFGGWWLKRGRFYEIEEKNKKAYNSLEILWYNADTIEFIFGDKAVRREFDFEWKLHNYGFGFQDIPFTKNVEVLRYSGDTIRIKFDNDRFQRRFETQWQKYSNHKLYGISQNIKKY